MQLVVLGINYQTADLALREKCAYHTANDFEVSILLRELIEHKLCDEAMILSTCNRTELYCTLSEHEHEPESEYFPLLKYLAKKLKVSLSELIPSAYFYTEDLAISHLMRVACGINSMVLGEVEILGQLKRAYQTASKAGTLGKGLSRLLQASFSVAKKVRSETCISVNPVSVASTAVRLAEQIFTDIKCAKILLVGAGDLIRSTALHLKAAGVTQLLLANRDRARAQRLAEELGVEVAIGLELIPSRLFDVDIVITGTASVLPIIGKGMVESALKLRKRRPMFIVDLSLPRNVEPEVSALENVYLYCIDDLKKMAEANLKKREQAVCVAEQIIQKETKAWMAWMNGQNFLEPLLGFREKVQRVGDEVLENALHQLKLGNKAPDVIIQRAIYKMTNRFLHHPTERLRRAAFEGEHDLLNLTQELFEL